MVSLIAKSVSSLQCVPIRIQRYHEVYVDLRYASSQGLFVSSPWETSPTESGEQILMTQIVRTGERVFDIGANIGLHTVLLSHIVGSSGLVFAFEPNPKLLRCLAQTVARLANTRLFPFALSDKNGRSDFYVPGDNSLGSLADWTRGRVRGKATRFICAERTVDELVAQKILPIPEFIKCDVEGAELKVFRGARETLNRAAAPIILFESNVYTSAGFGLSSSAARDFLSALPHPHYAFFSMKESGELMDSVPASEHANLLAIPESKMARVQTRGRVECG